MGFTTTIRVRRTPDEAFAAILNPRGWWGLSIEGDPALPGAEWSYRYRDLHFSRHRNDAIVPGRRVVWQVVDCDLSFLADRSEWTGTSLVFDITPHDGMTEIRFTHEGLEPSVECYGVCSNAWTGLIGGSLRDLIERGQGDPDSVERAA